MGIHGNTSEFNTALAGNEMVGLVALKNFASTDSSSYMTIGCTAAIALGISSSSSVRASFTIGSIHTGLGGSTSFLTGIGTKGSITANSLLTTIPLSMEISSATTAPLRISSGYGQTVFSPSAGSIYDGTGIKGSFSANGLVSTDTQYRTMGSMTTAAFGISNGSTLKAFSPTIGSLYSDPGSCTNLMTGTRINANGLASTNPSLMTISNVSAVASGISSGYGQTEIFPSSGSFYTGGSPTSLLTGTGIKGLFTTNGLETTIPSSMAISSATAAVLGISSGYGQTFSPSSGSIHTYLGGSTSLLSGTRINANGLVSINPSLTTISNASAATFRIPNSPFGQTVISSSVGSAFLNIHSPSILNESSIDDSHLLKQIANMIKEYSASPTLNFKKSERSLVIEININGNGNVIFNYGQVINNN